MGNNRKFVTPYDPMFDKIGDFLLADISNLQGQIAFGQWSLSQESMADRAKLEVRLAARRVELAELQLKIAKHKLESYQ